MEYQLRPPGPIVFDEQVDKSFAKFKAQFEYYMVATGYNNKPDERKVAILLNVAGDEAFTIFQTFNLTDAERADYSKVMAAFEDHCKPRTNETFERFKFFSRKQNEGESFDHFLTSLKTLAKTCNFQGEESLIRDIALIGIRDTSLRDSLLRTPNVTLADVESYCRTAEASKQQAKVFRGEEKSTEEVCQVKHFKKKPANRSRIRKGNEPYDCFKCGIRHTRGKCPAYGKTCKICNGPNHFAVGCKSKEGAMVFFAAIGIGVFIYGVVYLTALCFVDCDLQLAFYERLGKSPRRLKGKVVFITGASSGIGEHTAYALAKHGVKLVLTARRKNELERVKKDCISLSKGQLKESDILVIPVDITDTTSHKRIFESALNYFGTVDILVNNAGRSQRALFEEIELEVDRQMFDLNVFAVVNLSRIAVNYFNKKGSGHVAVVSSLAGVFGVPYSATYTGTKHAIHGYFGALRTEKTGKDIAVSLLCPGPTYTNFLSESFTGKEGEKYGIPAEPENRMTGERCGELCAVALVNKISEAWMGRFPMMLFTYSAVYFPIVSQIVLNIVGPTKLFKFRDNKEVTFDQGSNKAL